MVLPIVNAPDHGTKKLVLFGLGVKEAHASLYIALQRGRIVAHAAPNVLRRRSFMRHAASDFVCDALVAIYLSLQEMRRQG